MNLCGAPAHISSSPLLHSADSRHSRWPKLWPLPPQLSRLAVLCSDTSTLWYGCNSSPGRGLSDQRAHLMSFPSHSNHCFMLFILYCLKIVVIYRVWFYSCLWQESHSGASYFIMIRSGTLPFFSILAIKLERSVNTSDHVQLLHPLFETPAFVLAFQNVVFREAASAAPGSFWETQHLRSHTRHTDSEPAI